MQVEVLRGFEFKFTVDTGARLWALRLNMLKKVKNCKCLILVSFTVVLAGESRVDLVKFINCLSLQLAHDAKATVIFLKVLYHFNRQSMPQRHK